MPPEILRAAPQTVRLKQAALYLALGGVAVVIGDVFFFPWVRTYLAVSDKAIALARFKEMTLGLGASMAIVAVCFAIVSARVFIARQWPLPGATVWRDTPVVRGSGARLRAVMFALLALLFLGLGIYAARIPYLL